MSWMIDDIDFETYGVFVSKSSGVLDIPEIVDNSINWLDQNGLDFYPSDYEIKYKDHEIVLSCWIRANGYENFKNNVAAFYAALSGAGQRILQTPYGNSIDVSLQDSIQLTRKGSYVKSLQIGVFTLRLTVSGDSQTKLMTVYNSIGIIIGLLKYGNDSKHTNILQGERSISITSEFNSIQQLGRGDYINYDGSKYYSLEYPQIDKYSSNKFIYRVNYTHEFFILKDIQFRVIDRSNTFLWGNIQSIAEIIIDNADRVYSGLFEIGLIDISEYRNHNFNNESCYEVLTRIAGEYDYEYNFRNVGRVIKIDIKEKIATSTAIKLQYGKSNNLTKISRVSSGRENMVTRLYAYGSTRNIPAYYAYPRLKTTIEPLTREFHGMHVERTKVWDDIYPKRLGFISSYTYVAATDESKPETAKYLITDNSMEFDLNDKDIEGNTIYLIAGTTAKIHFQTGDLSGFEFEVKSYNHATQTFTIIPIKEENGNIIPNSYMMPVIDNTYVLLDINLPISYIEDAEEELLNKANEYIDENYAPKPTYSVELHPWANINISVGDIVEFIDNDFAFSGDLRVNEIVSNIYSNERTATLAWHSKKQRLSLFECKLTSIERSIVTANLDDVNTLKGSQKTVSEIKNTILNPLDEKLNADELVRKESIDPRMLSYDAGVPQYCIKDALLECNINGNEDIIRIGNGFIILTNWASKSRNEITELGANYNPTRTWIISETIIELESKESVWIYAKVNIENGSTECIVFASENHIEVKNYDGFLTYKIGSISKGEESV